MLRAGAAPSRCEFPRCSTRLPNFTGQRDGHIRTHRLTLITSTGASSILAALAPERPNFRGPPDQPPGVIQESAPSTTPVPRDERSQQ